MPRIDIGEKVVRDDGHTGSFMSAVLTDTGFLCPDFLCLKLYSTLHHFPGSERTF